MTMSSESYQYSAIERRAGWRCERHHKASAAPGRQRDRHGRRAYREGGSPHCRTIDHQVTLVIVRDGQRRRRAIAHGDGAETKDLGTYALTKAKTLRENDECDGRQDECYDMLFGGVSSHGRILLAEVSAVHLNVWGRFRAVLWAHEVVSGDGSIWAKHPFLT
jgi:hypothetical protein